MEWIRKARLFMAAVLASSLFATLVILMAEGRGREALPLHLCGLSALCAICLALRPRAVLLDWLWYLGMPGALLALMFPAPAVSRYQTAMNLSYAVTHMMILLIPGFLLDLGMRPNRGRASAMALLLNAVALPVSVVNRWLGTDFLFLSAPPAGTPLESIYALGPAVYLVCLETLALALCIGMERLAGLLFAESGE